MNLGTRMAAGAALAVASLGIAVASAGHADAVVEPAKYVQTSNLTNGKLTVTVKNNAKLGVDCSAAAYAADKVEHVRNYATALNTYWSGGMTEKDLSKLATKLGKTLGLTDGLTSAPGKSASMSWDSDRSDTSYAVLLTCQDSNNLKNGSIGAKGSLVEGTGSLLPTGFGSLESLLGDTGSSSAGSSGTGSSSGSS